MQKFNFVTDGSVVYYLAGNDWYAVMEDEDKVILVDTDCKISDKALRTPWSDGYWMSEDGENGQCILDYVNNIADTYFSNIKHAIEARTVDAGTGKFESAYMWPMSYEEFIDNKVIGGKIVENSNNVVKVMWTRTFSGVYINNNDSIRYAECINNSDSGFSDGYNVGGSYYVAPAFYLKKSAIDHITDDGKIVLKPAKADITD